MPNPSADTPISDTPAAEITPTETAAPASATPKWDKVEQERLTRRAALRKMGYTSGIAIFSMFAVDDLARMAIKQLEQHKETREIAETVAKEFKNSGIALAQSNSSSGCYEQNNPCSGATIGYNCQCCAHPGYTTATACGDAACDRCYPNRNPITNYANYVSYNQCLADYKNALITASC